MRLEGAWDIVLASVSESHMLGFRRWRNLGVTLTAIAMLHVSTPVLASAESDLARELFTRSGMERQLASVGAGLAKQIAAQATAIPADDRDLLVALAAAAFDREAMQREGLAELRSRMDTSKAEAALRWLDGELGRRIIRADEGASSPESLAQMEAFARSLGSDPPSEERLALVQRLDEASGASELTAGMMEMMTLSTGRAVQPAVRSARSAELLEEQLEAQLPLLRKAARNMTLIGMLFGYRGLSDADLTAYVSFLESPDGEWYVASTNGALAATMKAASQRFAIGLTGILESRSDPSGD